MKITKRRRCPECGNNLHPFLNPRGVINLGMQAYFCLFCNTLSKWIPVRKKEA